MVCLYCKAKTQVFNSRLQKKRNSVWRRRNCPTCGAAFSTIEQPDYEKAWVVQYADGPLSPFVRDKLFISIYQSCQHRSTALTDAIGLTDTVIAKLYPGVTNATIHGYDIAKRTHTALLHFDQAAAVHYHAYHHSVLI